MFRTRSVAFALGFSLLLLCAPAAFAVNCSCSFCVPGNLLAQCYWNAPGQGNVYCVDYWEFNCMMGGGGGYLAPSQDGDGTQAEPVDAVCEVAQVDQDQAESIEDSTAAKESEEVPSLVAD